MGLNVIVEVQQVTAVDWGEGGRNGRRGINEGHFEDRAGERADNIDHAGRYPPVACKTRPDLPPIELPFPAQGKPPEPNSHLR
jgi:hypothetical protein